MNCWEFMKCPQDILESCPAHPDRGVDCWKVTGTKCGQGRHAMESVGEKIQFCRQCEYYKEYANKI